MPTRPSQPQAFLPERCLADPRLADENEATRAVVAVEEVGEAFALAFAPDKLAVPTRHPVVDNVVAAGERRSRHHRRCPVCGRCREPTSNTPDSPVIVI